MTRSVCRPFAFLLLIRRHNRELAVLLELLGYIVLHARQDVWFPTHSLTVVGVQPVLLCTA